MLDLRKKGKWLDGLVNNREIRSHLRDRMDRLIEAVYHTIEKHLFLPTTLRDRVNSSIQSEFNKLIIEDETTLLFMH